MVDVLVCRGEEGTELKAKPSFYLLIYVPILTYDHRVMTERTTSSDKQLK